jgi:hypothetical protein
MTTEFYTGTDWEDSSGPICPVVVHESDVWPVDDNSESGAKDSLLDANGDWNGVHPVVAIGNRTHARRPLQRTGVVVFVQPGLTTASSQVVINCADQMVVRNYVANNTAYSGTTPITFVTTPYPGQPVFVDDSQGLAAGVTLSMSPLNEDGLENPLAGHLHYCQDEMRDDMVGGARAAATFDSTLADELVQQAYCIMLSSAKREMA